MTKIRLLTKPEQFVPGMKTDVYSEHGRFLQMIVVSSVNQDYINYKYDEKVFHHKLGDNYFGLVGYPERRKLTWEWVKEHIDEMPLKVYGKEGGEYTVLLIGKEGFRTDWLDDYDDNHKWSENSFYIDPPHPEVPEVYAPWEEKPDHQPDDDDKPPFDPSVRRLWWVNVGDEPFITDYAYTQEELKENFHSLKSYAPADAVPPESEWRVV
jgi:hypothetical protein